jgi:hypothetical protein
MKPAKPPRNAVGNLGRPTIKFTGSGERVEPLVTQTPAKKAFKQLKTPTQPAKDQKKSIPPANQKRKKIPAAPRKAPAPKKAKPSLLPPPPHFFKPKIVFRADSSPEVEVEKENQQPIVNNACESTEIVVISDGEVVEVVDEKEIDTAVQFNAEIKFTDQPKLDFIMEPISTFPNVLLDYVSDPMVRIPDPRLPRSIFEIEIVGYTSPSLFMVQYRRGDLNGMMRELK